MRLIKFLAAALVVSFILMPSLSSAQQKNEILIGLIPEMNIFKQKARFTALADYLSNKIGVKVKLTILSRYGNLIERFTEEKMDGAFFGSFTGALAVEKLGVVPLARPVNLDNTSTYHGYIFVRKDSNIRNAKDMKEKKMAFVEKATTAGYVFPLAYLKEHNIKSIDGFFKEYYFTGSHDAAIFAVLDKKADVGAAKHSIYDRVKKENPRIDNELIILAESPKVPSNGLFVRKTLDASLKSRLKEALLNIHNDPDGKEALEKFGAMKFIETTEGDYRPVFEMAKKAGIDIKTYDYKNK